MWHTHCPIFVRTLMDMYNSLTSYSNQKQQPQTTTEVATICPQIAGGEPWSLLCSVYRDTHTNTHRPKVTYLWACVTCECRSVLICRAMKRAGEVPPLHPEEVCVFGSGGWGIQKVPWMHRTETRAIFIYLCFKGSRSIIRVPETLRGKQKQSSPIRAGIFLFLLFSLISHGLPMP